MNLESLKKAVYASIEYFFGILEGNIILLDKSESDIEQESEIEQEPEIEIPLPEPELEKIKKSESENKLFSR